MENQFSDKVSKYFKILNQNTYLHPHIYYPIIFYPLIGITSYKLFKLFPKLQSIRNFNKLIMNAIPIQQNLETNIQNKLIYIQGKVTIQNQLLAKDSLFKISTSSLDQLGLYRKVEVFHNSSLYHQYKCKWQDLNTLENINRFYDASSIRCNVAANGNIFLADQQLNTPLLIQLSESNSVQQQIDVKFMKQLIQEIQQKKEQLQNGLNMDKDQQKYVTLNEIAENPLEKLIFLGKHIEIDQQYIQIMEQKGKLSKGDIRISFHEIRKIATATALAVQGKNGLTQFQSLDFDEGIEYFTNNNKISQKTSLFSFISKGLINQKELVDILISDSQSTVLIQYKKVLIYCIIIFSLYLHLQQIGEEYFCDFDTRQAISQQILELQNKSHQIETNRFKIDKDMFKYAFLLSSCHIACLKFVSSGHLLISSSLLMLGLMSYSYNQFVESQSFIDGIKEDLGEMKKNMEDQKTQQMKDYFNGVINKLN
ncbi:hypothetical protein ABPG74_001519 [Tetrahymena malaccensis]